MKKKVLLGLFIFSFFSVAFSAPSNLSLKVFFTTDSSLEAKDIDDSDFEFNDHINSYYKDGFCWIQTEISSELIEKQVRVLKFSDELFNYADVYYLDSKGNWNFLGKTGFEVSSKNKNSQYYDTAVIFPFDMDFPEKGMPLKIRARIYSDHSIYVCASAMTMNEWESFQHHRNILISLFVGAVIMTIFFIAFACISFRDFTNFYFIIVCIVLALYVLFVNGFLDYTFASILHWSNIRNSIIYFVIVGTSLCGCWSLINRNRDFIKCFPAPVVKIQNFFPFIVLYLLTNGILFMILPVSDNFLYGYRVMGITVPYVFYIIQMLSGLKYNPAINRKICFFWMVSCGLIFIQQVFLCCRFKSWAPKFFRIFDEDKGIPEAFALFIIGITVVDRLNERIRTNLASLQIQMSDVSARIEKENKYNFVYSKIFSKFLNMLQVFASLMEEYNDEDVEKIKISVRSTMNGSMQLIKTLAVISEEEKDVYGGYYNPSPVYLHTLVTQMMENEYAVLKMNNCFVDVYEYYSEESCVYADKDLLYFILKLIIQTVHNVAIPKTHVLVSAEYKKGWFSFSCKFSGVILSIVQAKRILGLELHDKDDFEKDELIKKWGFELYVASLISQFLKGSISIIPDTQGCVICARLPLDPAITYLEENFHVQNFINGKDEDLGIPSCNEIVYILEENTSVRTILEKSFSPYFKTIILGNGLEFLDQMKNNKPDFVICSMDLPGKNARELLDMDELKSVPFFVTTKFATRKIISDLYSHGAIDVFQKPFNIENMVRKVYSTIKIRKNQTECLLEMIHNMFSQAAFSKNQVMQHELIEKIGKNENEFVFQLKSFETSSTENQKKLSEPKDVFAKKSEQSQSKVSINDRNQLEALFVSAGLTKKESMIGMLIAQGMSDKEIAQELFISPSTVAVHNKKIFKKLNIHNRNELLEKIR